MALTPVAGPARALRAPSNGALAVLSSALRNLRISNPLIGVGGQTRNASHQAQGRANGAKDGAGKRLGAKKTAGEYVVPGNILFKQRGTLWFPGDHCFMGRDHTIHAGAPGYVRYYRDPSRHPKRKYIGIVFEKNQTLPQAVHAVRRRKLGMLAYQIPSATTEQLAGDLTEETPTDIREQPNDTRALKTVKKGKTTEGLQLTLRPGYQYRQANYEIGRSGDRKEAEAQRQGKTTKAYPDFQRGDRFKAWRKRSERITRNKEQRALRSGKGKSKK